MPNEEDVAGVLDVGDHLRFGGNVGEVGFEIVGVHGGIGGLLVGEPLASDGVQPEAAVGFVLPSSTADVGDADRRGVAVGGVDEAHPVG